MNFEYDHEEGDIKFPSGIGENSISTFGGELNDEFGVWDSYGIQIGDLAIHDIPSTDMIKLGLTILNHLIVNGHDFVFSDEDPYYQFLKSK